jgi:hypothetical protein
LTSWRLLFNSVIMLSLFAPLRELRLGYAHRCRSGKCFRSSLHRFLRRLGCATQDQLRIMLAPLSSRHRTRALEILCAALNQTNIVFPGTELQMRYSVATFP